ncbi:MAG: ATP:cob(I)alamin adenosyltransferase [Treponema sp.]|nr:ATP:cob(I)alamin adenosyltransferase [Treponema sp.]
MTDINNKTSNLHGKEVSKNDISLHFIGTADELNCHLGLIKAMLSNDETWQFTWQAACKTIERIQKNLMKLMSHVSDNRNEEYFFHENDISGLENETARLMGNLPKQSKFTLPGRNIIEAQIQIARTVARRAERMYAAVKEKEVLCSNAALYLNRLSKYLYYLSQQESLINVNFINQFTGI